MRPLTTLERDGLVRRIAQSLAWSATSSVNRDDYTFRARAIVRDLEAVAVHGATDKRAAEAVLKVVDRTA